MRFRGSSLEFKFGQLCGWGPEHGWGLDLREDKNIKECFNDTRGHPKAEIKSKPIPGSEVHANPFLQSHSHYFVALSPMSIYFVDVGLYEALYLICAHDTKATQRSQHPS